MNKLPYIKIPVNIKNAKVTSVYSTFTQNYRNDLGQIWYIPSLEPEKGHRPFFNAKDEKFDRGIENTIPR